MGDKNRKKYLRRMAVSSICAIVLCLACLMPATLALFAVDFTTEGNVIEVAQFTATSKTVVKQETLALEEPVVIPEKEICPEGSYELQINWNGNTAGYIKVNLAVAAADSKTASAAYVVNLPASDEENTYDLAIPLTLHEEAVITTESSWGVYEAAEGENTVVLGLDNVIAFITGGGISFGTPFETAVTIGTDVIGKDVESAEAYEPGTYYLTIDWTPDFAGYCVLDFVTGEENSDTAPAKYIIRLPKVEETEGGENIVITIPLYLHEKTRITAATGKGTPDNSVEWQENAGISFGAQFIVSAGIGQVNTEYVDISLEAYEPDTYLLKLDWTKADADGYCKITVGTEEYYLSCPKDAESKERVITLDLKKEAVITVTAVKGVLPEGVTPLEDSVVSVIYGAQFEAVAAIGAVVSETETQFASINSVAYEAGTYQLKLSWTSNVDGYCVITVGEELYYLSCPVGGEAVVIPLELKDAAVVTVTSGMGKYSGEAQLLTAEGIIFEVQQADE